MKKSFIIIVLLACQIFFTDHSRACTRVVYQGPDSIIITARSMDWKTDIPAALWIFPRGMERDGAAGPNAIKWVSKYGSVVTSSFGNSSADGMNEKGLVANILWLAESEFPAYDVNNKSLSVGAWVQYVLDNYATVREVVEAFNSGEPVLVSSFIPGTTLMATLHLSVSDARGDNAILEYIGGKLVVHHHRSYNVMTNSPVFEKQLAIREYWEQIGGTTFLPGTNRAADRFVRAAFYIRAIPQTPDIRTALAATWSVIRNCSVPFGIASEKEPNISSTRWRSVADHKNLVYYFETVTAPNVFMVDMKKIDFNPGAPVLMLNVEDSLTGAVDASGIFVKAEPFAFAGL